MRAAPAAPAPTDAAAATAAIAALGAGVVGGIAGIAGSSPALALAGAATAAAALTIVLAAGWLPPLVVLALTLPLPALYGEDELRVPAAAVVGAVVLFAWALGRAGPAGARRVELPVAPRRAAAALLAAIALAAAFADVRAAAARELVNFALLLGLLVVAMDILARDRRRVRALALTIAAVAGLAGLPAALQAVGALPAEFVLSGTAFHRATLGFGWPNELGVFFAVSLPFCWYAVRAATGPALRLLAIAGLGAAGLGLLATFSRGAWLAFLVSAGILVFAGGARLAFRIALGAVAVVALIDVASGGVVTGRLFSLADDPYVVQRAALMLVGVLMFRDNPIVGVGPGGFREHLEEYGPGVPWLWDYVGSAHNAYLEIAAEAGIIGLAMFLWFLGAHFRLLVRGARAAREAPAGSDGAPDDGAAPDAPLRRALLWSFTAACLACFTAWPFAHGIGQLIMLVAAMGVVATRAP